MSDRRFAALVLLANAAVTLTYAAVNVDLPVIAESLSANALLLPDGYILGVACTVGLTPTLLGAWGPRRLLMISLCGVVATSAIASLAHSGPGFAGALFLHGLFAAPTVPATQTLCATRRADERSRHRLGSFWMATTLLGTLTGYTVGGWVTDHAGWRCTLLLCWIPALLATGLLRNATLHGEDDGADPRVREAGVDIVAATLLGAVLVSLTALVFVGARGGWGVHRGMRRMGAALVLAVMALVARSRRASRPLIDLSVLADRRVAGALLCTFILDASSTGIFQTEMLGVVVKLDPEWLALRSSLGGLSMVIGVGLAAHLLRRFSLTSTVIVGLVVLLTGKLGFLGYCAGCTFSRVLWPAMVSSAGYGMLSTVLAITACDSASPRRSAAMAALYAVAVQMGASVGLAGLDAVLDGCQEAMLRRQEALDLHLAYLQVFTVEAALAALILPLALALLRGVRRKAGSDPSS